MARRARSAERAGVDPMTDGVVGRLTEALERMVSKQKNSFRAPTYDGLGDVELFIQQFMDVVEANQWAPAAALLHLREALKEGARDCGRSQTIDGIFVALRARYGLSPREARARLNGLRKEARVSLQEHATEVQRLINIAYADLPDHNRETMVIDTFCSTLGNAYLQRHLLAFPIRTLEAAVQAGSEFLQIKNTSSSGGVVRQVEEDEPEARQVKSADTDLITSLTKMVQMLAEKVERMSERTKPSGATKPDGRGEGCWGCKQPGHVRKDCEVNPWPARRGEKVTTKGNGQSPQ